MTVDHPPCCSRLISFSSWVYNGDQEQSKDFTTRLSPQWARWLGGWTPCTQISPQRGLVTNPWHMHTNMAMTCICHHSTAIVIEYGRHVATSDDIKHWFPCASLSITDYWSLLENCLESIAEWRQRLLSYTTSMAIRQSILKSWEPGTILGWNLTTTKQNTIVTRRSWPIDGPFENGAGSSS